MSNLQSGPSADRLCAGAAFSCYDSAIVGQLGDKLVPIIDLASDPLSSPKVVIEDKGTNEGRALLETLGRYGRFGQLFSGVNVPADKVIYHLAPTPSQSSPEQND